MELKANSVKYTDLSKRLNKSISLECHNMNTYDGKGK